MIELEGALDTALGELETMRSEEKHATARSKEERHEAAVMLGAARDELIRSSGEVRRWKLLATCSAQAVMPSYQLDASVEWTSQC